MARNENPPFERGLTGMNGATIDTNNLFGFQDVGKDWLFEDVNPNTKQSRTNRYVRCRVVRNVSTVALLPKRLVTFKTSGTPAGGTGQVDPNTWGAEVDGYATGDGVAPGLVVPAYPVDEFLPAAGVPVNDTFWIVVEGPAMCKTPLNTFNKTISIGDKVCAASTAAGTTGTTAGRVESVVYINMATTGDTGSLRADVRQDTNFVGYALSSVTNAQTDTDILVDVVPM